ncbi:MAG: 50S ribosomal protein L22 [Elusimicrobiota bacterium]
MEAKAIARNQRISPRKVAQVLNTIRGKSVNDAMNKLSFMTKSAKKVVEKTLFSAVSNAGKNVDVTHLKVKKAWVTEATHMKRIKAAAQGRAVTFRHRISHLTIVVGD